MLRNVVCSIFWIAFFLSSTGVLKQRRRLLLVLFQVSVPPIRAYLSSPHPLRLIDQVQAASNCSPTLHPSLQRHSVLAVTVIPVLGEPLITTADACLRLWRCP